MGRQSKHRSRTRKRAETKRASAHSRSMAPYRAPAPEPRYSLRVDGRRISGDTFALLLAAMREAGISTEKISATVAHFAIHGEPCTLTLDGSSEIESVTS